MTNETNTPGSGEEITPQGYLRDHEYIKNDYGAYIYVSGPHKINVECVLEDYAAIKTVSLQKTIDQQAEEIRKLKQASDNMREVCNAVSTYQTNNIWANKLLKMADKALAAYDQLIGKVEVTAPKTQEREERNERQNWNNYVKREGLNKWHKVDKTNFVPPKNNILLLFFTESGSIYCGKYKGSRGFICYGISKQELADVEVTHWRNLDFPEEYQQFLDSEDDKYSTTKQP